MDELSTKDLTPVGNNKLTKQQSSLLEVLRDPKSLKWSTSKICQEAGISRGTFYNSFEDKDFVTALEAAIQGYVKSREFQVLHNIFDKASDPKEKGHHWALMAERIAGRLEAEARKPALVQVIFTNVQRPKVKVDEKEQKALVELQDDPED